LTFTHHTGPAAGHSPRSLFHAAFRYLLCRTLSRPGRVFLFAINPATLMGFVGALRSIPWPRVPASLRFIPTCRSSTRWRLVGSLIFTSLPVAEYLKLLPQVNEFQLRPAHRAHDSTGFWVLLPRTSQTACIARFRVGIACALQAANPAMGFVGFSRACWMLCSQHARGGRAPGSPSSRTRTHAAHRRSLAFRLGCHPLMGFAVDRYRTCARGSSRPRVVRDASD